MYPSYPPPIPLWAIGMPRRKFVPYFGKHYTPPPTTTTTTTTTAKPAVLDSSCSHLPSSCWNNSPYLPLPLECIGVIQNMLTILVDDSLIHIMYVHRYLCCLQSLDPPASDVGMFSVSNRESSFAMHRNNSGKSIFTIHWERFKHFFLIYRPCSGDRCH